MSYDKLVKLIQNEIDLRHVLNLEALCVKKKESKGVNMALVQAEDGKKANCSSIKKEDNRCKGKKLTGQYLGTDWLSEKLYKTLVFQIECTF